MVAVANSRFRASFCYVQCHSSEFINSTDQQHWVRRSYGWPFAPLGTCDVKRYVSTLDSCDTSADASYGFLRSSIFAKKAFIDFSLLCFL